MTNAALLSQFNRVGGIFFKPRSFSNTDNQVNSHVVRAMALYSASAEDLEIIDCFLDLPEIGDFLKKMQYHMVDRRDTGHEAQLLSQYAVQ